MTRKTSPAAPAIESEQEDYREKNAREGTALYIPGKAPEQIGKGKAAGPDLLAGARTFSIELSDAEWDDTDTSIPDLLELVYDAGNLFSMLADGLATGFLTGQDTQVGSLSRMAARALRSAENKEIPALDRLDMKLRQVAAQHAKAKIQCETEGRP